MAGKKGRSGVYPRPPADKAERMSRFPVQVMPSGCHIWGGAKSRAGYGQLRIKWKAYYAHRMMWELTNGPIPDGLHVLHHCDTPACVNPAHLFLGSHADNMADMKAKGRRKTKWT